MIRLALPLFASAALGVAGCSTSDPAPPPGPVTTALGTPIVSASGSPVASAGATAYRPGFGIIESISLVYPPAAASAGGTAPAVSSGPYRFTMRMDDGSVQTIVLDSRAFLVGDRVQVMADGRLIRA